MDTVTLSHGCLCPSSILPRLRMRTPQIARASLVCREQVFAIFLSNTAHLGARKCRARASQILATVQEATKLKEGLFIAIEAADGSLDEACLAIVSSLEHLHSVPDISSSPHLLKGCLVAAKANFKENRRDGKVRHLGYLGALSSLGSLTFNLFKPVDLEISLYNMYQHVSMESADAYTLITEFSIVQQQEEPPLQGLIINRGRFSSGGSNRLDIQFTACEMRPRHPERDVDAWLKLLKEHNPGMDEKGCALVSFPVPFKGWSDVLYMDDEIRIQKGNKGGVSVLCVLKEPAIAI